MTGVNEIRTAFLDYFEKNDHTIVDSSPLVPRNDPTLMFTAAGMVQFKNVFTGIESQPYSRAATAQKCVRAGGKHNDLDNVGYTARHHTFFEMLGNFSFGDYFKEQAIELAWNLITKEFEVNKDRLLVTVYHTDDEAVEFWKKIAGLPESRIIKIATSDNFWAAGDSGPCGPCSEIFYDHGDHIFGGPPGSPDEDGDRFIEIWNLVFMQYDQIGGGKRADLPRPSIDTGMGLERISALLQGKHDNYDIDLFRALIANSEEHTGVAAEGEARASHRVIADHLRASAFLIADGVLPSNEGRGYVLRRIMRRAMRHARLLGAQEPLIWKLLPVLVSEMGRAYPELVRAEALTSETLKLEETRFRKTLDRGLGLLSDATEDMSKGDTLDGQTAFKLYDTYGFPLDLTQDALRQRDISVDEDGFKQAMEKQKAEARASWSGSGEAATEVVWLELKSKLGATDFLGYATLMAQGIVTAMVFEGKTVNEMSKGSEFSIISNQTPFYGESGGQMGDTGKITGADFEFEVTNTLKKAGGLFVHFGKLISGQLKVGDEASFTVDVERRALLCSNHSATHLLHEALREVLGEHVMQKGSLVSPERLRFDVSHPKPIDLAEIKQTEVISNEMVLQNSVVSTRLMSVDDAIEEGAMALFGEKYGDEVRVVSMGTATIGKKAGKTYSLELCGGTHVKSTGDIGLIHIVGESAVAAGVRRIEALTGAAARDYLVAQDKNLLEISGALRVQPGDVLGRVQTLMDERKKMEREISELKKRIALGDVGQGENDDVQQIGKIKFLGKRLDGVAAKELKGLADDALSSLGSGVGCFVSVSEDNRASVVVAVSKDLVDSVSAVDLVRVASNALGGKGGGGRPDMAQAGGPDGEKAQLAIDAVSAALAAQ